KPQRVSLGQGVQTTDRIGKTQQADAAGGEKQQPADQQQPTQDREDLINHGGSVAKAGPARHSRPPPTGPAITPHRAAPVAPAIAPAPAAAPCRPYRTVGSPRAGPHAAARAPRGTGRR